MLALDPATLEAEFFARTAPLRQVQIDFLRREGVPPLALARDGDGFGCCLGTAQVERCGKRFDFREDGEGAFVVLARDELGDPTDFVSWAPRANWFAPWLGATALLGAQELFAPRFDEPLRVFLHPLGWLKARREGVVVLDGKRARRQLGDVHVEAESIEAGDILERMLAWPLPRISVPATAIESVAA